MSGLLRVCKGYCCDYSKSDLLDCAPCPPPVVSYIDFREYAFNLSLSVTEVCSIARRCMQTVPDLTSDCQNEEDRKWVVCVVLAVGIPIVLVFVILVLWKKILKKKTAETSPVCCQTVRESCFGFENINQSNDRNEEEMSRQPDTNRLPSPLRSKPIHEPDTSEETIPLVFQVPSSTTDECEVEIPLIKNINEQQQEETQIEGNDNRSYCSAEESDSASGSQYEDANDKLEGETAV